MANPNPNSAKPWKVDYAKTSRSSCKTCKNSIVKGSLRIAKMVTARQFEGIMPMWNHADCVLMHRGQFQKINDLEGFDALQIEDQDKIKKYLHDLDDNSVPATFEKTEIDGIEDSFIEKAKSSRSTCKSCNQKIVKGEVRISTTADPENPWYRGTMSAWRHAKCFIEIGWWTSPVEKMSGWDNLSDEDKQAVKDMTEQYIKSGKIDPKHKLEENDSGHFPNKKTKMSKGDTEASEENAKKLKKQTKKGGLVIDALGFLKTLVAGMFGRIPLETDVPGGMKGMEDIPSDLVDTVKYLKKAKTQLEHLQSQNEELKATNVLAKSKLEKEFAVVQLSATHQKELEAFADDQRPLMEMIYKACLYKQVQKVK
uniref:TSA: Wollemia nobilis Ref_Wollemi_Transcript_14988_1486 transcribed RNA sequence n=1 Tax=Wollemia nobilis TaxID=56998 RepID=A0A0C9RJ76_9CONI